MVWKLREMPPAGARLMLVSRGAGSTMILKLRVALRLGVPLSLTRTVARLVLGAGTAIGVQLNSPVAGLIAAPAGKALSRLKVSISGGASGSEATIVKVSVCPR